MNPPDLVLPLILMTWSFITLYYYSEFGEMVTNKFQLFHDRTIQCEWYLFPHDIQRIFLIFIKDTQQTVFIRGYGNLECTRETFKAVGIFQVISFYRSDYSFCVSFFFFDHLDWPRWIFILYDAESN